MASFFISKYNSGWRIIEETWNNGNRSHKTVPKLACEALGFNPAWTVDQARKHVKTLNKRSAQERKLQSKMSATARRIQLAKDVESSYLPEYLVDDFHKHLLEASFGSPQHNQRTLSHWKTVCVMIKALKLEALKFSDNTNKIYQYFISQHYSADYCNKLIRILNMWGKFVCKHHKLPFEPVPVPKGNQKNKIDDSYLESDGFIGESDPLTPEHLSRSQFTNSEHKNWLSLSVWFGLRPLEIDNLKNSATWKIEIIEGTQILWVYQSKLTSIERSKRWKGIPCVFPEQKSLLPIIESGELKRPILKTLEKILGTDRIGVYGGRKGFIDLMLDRGQKLEDISMWLGHQSIEMTWKKYRNKRRVSFTKAG